MSIMIGLTPASPSQHSHASWYKWTALRKHLFAIAMWPSHGIYWKYTFLFRVIQRCLSPLQLNVKYICMDWCPGENFMVVVYYGGCVEEVTIMERFNGVNL